MFESGSHRTTVGQPLMHPMQALKDSTNRLPSASTKSEKLSQSLGRFQSMRKNAENKGEKSNNENSRRSRNLEHQSSRSSLLSRSSSRNFEPEEELPVNIEEIRISSNGSKSVHKYIRGRLLGKGGFAKVYLCTSLDTQKNYAVKIVPKANLVKSRARQKLQAEIKIHRTLKNKRICEFKHFFEDRKNCYILLELCPSQTLNELLKRRKRLTELEVMYFMHQLIEGVQFMHSCNVIHRDLKLGNLFLDRHMGVKIGDFGLAVKLGNSSEKRTTICGTPNYIAPEVIDCLNGGQRGHSFEVDVWAMGVIMYATLVGKPPYEAKDVKSTYKRILNNEYSFPNKLPISDHAKTLISGMLQSNPENRPSIEQVAQHAFFSNRRERLPLSLPSKCTRSAPIWREDENGLFVTEFPRIETENCCSTSKGKVLSQDTQRKPLNLLDTNARKEKLENANTAKAIRKNSRRCAPLPLQNALGTYDSTNGCKTNSDRYEAQRASGTDVTSKVANQKFKIFSDAEQQDMCEDHNKKHPQSHVVSEGSMPVDNITSNLEKMNMREKRHETSVARSDDLQHIPVIEINTRHPSSATRNDAYSQIEDAVKNACGSKTTDIMEAMHSRLEKSFNAKEHENCTEETHGAQKLECSPVWVSRYVDYTSKYGLGFILNDGSSGVYFNDSTKIVLAPEGDIFQYIERRKANLNQKVTDQEIEPTIHIYSLTSYPSQLQKKVTLLQHFRNYLIEQQKTSNEETIKNIISLRKKSEIESSANSVSPYVYLKKWVRTRHAILFRLSNCTVQVVFYDHTEVLLSSEARLVTYVDKGGNRTTYPIHEITKDPNGEVGKRLKYAKDILQQLISGVK